MPSTLRAARPRKVVKSLQIARAEAASAVRECTPSLPYMRESWVSTVFGVTNSVAAISLFDRPSATRSATRRSAGVSTPAGERLARRSSRDRPAREPPTARRRGLERRPAPVRAFRAPPSCCLARRCRRPMASSVRAVSKGTGDRACCGERLVAAGDGARRDRRAPRARSARPRAARRERGRAVERAPALLEPAEHRLGVGRPLRARSPLRPRRPGTARGPARGHAGAELASAQRPRRSATRVGPAEVRGRAVASAHSAWILATAIARSPAIASAPAASSRASSARPWRPRRAP